MSDSEAVIELAKRYSEQYHELCIKSNELFELKNKYEKKKLIW
jgi:hypothetical protein